MKTSYTIQEIKNGREQGADFVNPHFTLGPVTEVNGMYFCDFLRPGTDLVIVKLSGPADTKIMCDKVEGR